MKSIQSVTFPTTLQYIGNQAFGSNGNMGDVYISDLSAWCRVNRDGDESVMSSTLYLNGVEVVDLVIPDDVDRIGTYAFSRFSSIKTVTMPNTVTEIGEGAFMHTWYLERISLSDAVTVLPEKLFYENRNLQEIKMPEQLESIGKSSFYLCDSVKEITIPAKVSKIEVDAFTQCWGLSKAYFENPNDLVLAYAWNYPDGLCGGVLANGMNAPLILTMPKYEGAVTAYAKSLQIHQGIVLGGDGLITDRSVAQIFDLGSTDSITQK